MNIKKRYEKYKDVIPYLFFGVCTTLVNVFTYALFARILLLGVMVSTVLAWVLAVVFAYVTNRKWVFHSAARGAKKIVKELVSFFGCRLATGVIDWALMFVFVERLQWNDLFVKIGANIVVIVLNYIASKWIIFKKKG